LRTENSRSIRSSSVSSGGHSSTARARETTIYRPLRPTFIPVRENIYVEEEEEFTEISDDIMVAYDEYYMLPNEVKIEIILNQYMNQKREKLKKQRGKKRKNDQKEYKDSMNKFPLPKFDSSGKMTERSWVHK
jgi:hypothetical protein